MRYTVGSTYRCAVRYAQARTGVQAIARTFGRVQRTGRAARPGENWPTDRYVAGVPSARRL